MELLQKSAIYDTCVHEVKNLLTVTSLPAIIKLINGIFIPFNLKGGS